MIGWHHQFNGHELEQNPGVGDGQGSLACCSPRGREEWDTTWWLNNNNHGFEVINSPLDQISAPLTLSCWQIPSLADRHSTTFKWAVIFICHHDYRHFRHCQMLYIHHFSFELFFQNINRSKLDYQQHSTECCWPNTPFSNDTWDHFLTGNLNFLLRVTTGKECPDGPVVRTLCFHCKGQLIPVM